jgi:hypothetical protein
MRPVIYVLFLLVLAPGCGSETAGTARSAGSQAARAQKVDVPLLASSAVPHGLSHQDRRLEGSDLVREAHGAGGIAGLVDGWQLLGAGERSFRGTTRDLTSVVSRTLDFAAPAGAAGFVAFVRDHPDTYLGPVKTSRAVDTGGRRGVVLTARGCGCHGETPLLLYVASEGSRVSWVMINGPRATTARALRLGAAAP